MLETIFKYSCTLFGVVALSTIYVQMFKSSKNPDKK
ncbi:hypothetical protein JOC74_000811 [Bacillus capparidis]|uniref:Uncharacterized protein n=1 Tax=Bacillus capparidis TaxID=1840411 RepID=A0ABS4CT97_9BACI|nr:hypothetical protein [Bacillus capparidis]